MVEWLKDLPADLKVGLVMMALVFLLLLALIASVWDYNLHLIASGVCR